MDRHFYCMNKCPMGDCVEVCKRLAYPKLIAALIDLTNHDMSLERAKEVLHELGES